MPLPGSYGRFYGSSSNLKTYLDRHGSLIDPLRLHTLAAYCSLALRPTNEFFTALLKLKKSIKRVGKENFSIVISPVRDIEFSTALALNRDTILNYFLDELMLGSNQIIKTKPAYPSNLFSTRTHLSCYGREKFTAELAEFLENKINFEATLSH